MEAVANLTKQENFRFGMEKDKLRNHWCKLFQNFSNANTKKMCTQFLYGGGGRQHSQQVWTTVFSAATLGPHSKFYFADEDCWHSCVFLKK
jgi:hypothetical protein